jgi:hypothetical protein
MITTTKIDDRTYMATDGREQAVAGTRATARRKLLAELAGKREDAQVYASEQRHVGDCDCPSGWHASHRQCRN